MSTPKKPDNDHEEQDIKRVEMHEYLLYLNNGSENFQKYKSKLEQPQAKDTFIDNANGISKYIQETQGYPALLELRIVANQKQPNYIHKNACKPGVIATFTSANSIEPIGWESRDKVFGWPFIQLVGEVVSESSDMETLRDKIVDNLHYMVLDRPDLYVSHALLIEDSRVTFLCGVTGKGIFDVQLYYTDPNLQPLLFALISHIYDPGRFKDERYAVAFNIESRQSQWSLRFETKPGVTQWETFRTIYASNPFATATYVFVASDKSSPIMVNGQRLRVVKDQYCYRKTRLSEPDILRHIRGTPGVVTLAYDEEWEPPVHSTRRIKRRMWFVEEGDKFMNIRSVREMLEAAYDVLEVTRYLRFKRHVLHCDLSIANIVVNVAPTTLTTKEYTDRQYNNINEHGICFIKHLLGESNNPRQTSVLLIDFNLAERLDTTATRDQIKRRGTDLFMARAVQNEGPYPELSAQMFTAFIALPQAPPIYKQLHPERAARFDADKIGLYIPSEDQVNLNDHRVWRHELYHEAESIFWIIVYWLLLANPEPGTKPSSDAIPLYIWASLIDNTFSRDIVIRSFHQDAKHCARIIHSKLLPVLGLLRTLAWAVYPGPYFLPDDNPRTQPDYLHEVFQRAILDFILANEKEEFMDLEINVLNPRHHAGYKREDPSSNSHLTSSDTSRHCSKRSLSSAEHEQNAPVNDSQKASL